MSGNNWKPLFPLTWTRNSKKNFLNVKHRVHSLVISETLCYLAILRCYCVFNGQQIVVVHFIRDVSVSFQSNTKLVLHFIVRQIPCFVLMWYACHTNRTQHPNNTQYTCISMSLSLFIRFVFKFILSRVDAFVRFY